VPAVYCPAMGLSIHWAETRERPMVTQIHITTEHPEATVATLTPPRKPAAERSSRGRAERRVKSALSAETLDLHYQPIFELFGHAPVAVEALLRLWDGDGKALDVSQSIFTAEQSGQIGMVDRWVAGRVLSRLGRHQFSEGLRVHINVSPLELLDPRFVQGLADAAAEIGVEPGEICLEITERMPLPDQSRFLLRRLRSMGFLVAIDDFGSGWAGIGTFADIPADIVKIDRSLVRKLHRSERARRVFVAAVEMIHSVGQIAVAEGVENEAQLSFVTEVGCDQVQGFYLGKPVPEGILSASVRDWRSRGQ